MKKPFILIVCFLQIIKAPSSSASTLPALPHTEKQTDSYYNDTTLVNQQAPLTYQNTIVKQRLDSIANQVPLAYNEYVQSYIDIYAHNRDEMGHVLGLTKYYFPIYEKAFRDAGIPEELKYLSIVESKLDPYAVSRVGATGPWQFMFTTARLYGLNMDNYVDDRRDPVQASYAAAAYLKDAYQQFGDWLLAIASYNCGKSNVEHAIEKAGAHDFWIIRQYLPPETRNYVPAYIAITYLMNYYSKHNIVPQNCTYALTTDTVLVNKYIALPEIAKALEIDIKELAFFNPAYKKQIINGTADAPRRLVVPQVDNEKYAALYEALNTSTIAAPQVVNTVYDETPTALPLYHKVKRGETLGNIADTYGVELQDIKVWNHLHSNKAVIGQKLKLSATAGGPATPLVKHHSNYVTYKVKNGDTLSGIAARFYGASVEKIKSLNGLKKSHLEPGMTIKINRG